MPETNVLTGSEINTSNKKTLKDIREPVAEQLQDFQAYFKETLSTDVMLLDQILRYLLRQKGKELRPTLVFLSAQLFGSVNERSFIAATMVELLHTATLIHDDVVDEADKRRGFLSINKVWKNKAGVLLGDFLLSRGLLIALDNDEFKLLKVLSKAVKSMSEGELRQMKASKLFNMTEEKYFRIITEKTASLLAACCECGAISTSDDDEIHEQMHQIGIDLGIAFQIRDDLFDYGVDDVGKPSFNDIKDRKVTLPLIHSFHEAPDSERRSIRSLMKKKRKTNDEIRKIVDFVSEHNGIEYATNQMFEYANNAKEKVETLVNGTNRDQIDHFKGLIDFTITRKK